MCVCCLTPLNIHSVMLIITVFSLCLIRDVYGYKFEETLGHIRPRTNGYIQAEAAFEVIKRTIPARAQEFSVEVDSNFITEGKESFQIIKENGIVKLKGTTGVAALTGFHHYVKYFCKGHISWEVSQLNLPNKLPDVNITITLNDRFRYYQNVCTTSYSFVWWDWNKWEKHIDWMALNSFNLVLAFNGQEEILRRVYLKLNLTEEDINEHFTGPAFLSWLRMGNIRGWGGPLPQSWHNRTLILQKKILNRMRSLGIIPVLPAFAGHLPRAFKRLYPSINVTKMDVWNDFNDTYCCPYFLDPTEELFKTIGKLFIQEQITEFGTDHMYNCDSFNEVDPATSDLVYLSNVGKAIYEAMTAADPNAIWVMQGWLFHSSDYWVDIKRIESFITSLPLGKMVVLDLQSEQFPQYERLDQYFGQPYIWCMLHNFGGTLGMFGSANIINEKVIEARNDKGSTMIGTGLTPEGINQNYVIYDLMTESAWRTEPANLTEWFMNYTIRRYGKQNPHLIKAWEILKDTLYDYNDLVKIRGRYAITSTPSLKLNVWTWYNYSDVLDAWGYFIETAQDMRNKPAFLHDLVDITRQSLQIFGEINYKMLVPFFRAKDMESFKPVADAFMQIFYDMELILASSENFLLGTWLESAKFCADNKEEKKLFEYNARNQISLWGPKGEIVNYANKQWSGVVSHYFEPRWNIFIEYLKEIIQYNSTYNETFIRQTMFKNAEEPFTFDTTSFPTEPTGDTVAIATDIYQRWNVIMEKISKHGNFDIKPRTERSSGENVEEQMEWKNYYTIPKVIMV